MGFNRWRSCCRIFASSAKRCMSSLGLTRGPEPCLVGLCDPGSRRSNRACAAPASGLANVQLKLFAEASLHWCLSRTNRMAPLSSWTQGRTAAWPGFKEACGRWAIHFRPDFRHKHKSFWIEQRCNALPLSPYLLLLRRSRRNCDAFADLANIEHDVLGANARTPTSPRSVMGRPLTRDPILTVIHSRHGEAEGKWALRE